MDETQDEAFSGPINYDVDGHIVVVQCDFVRIAPLGKGTSITEETANPGKAAVPDPGARVRDRVNLERAKDGPRDSAMHCSLFEGVRQV